MRAVLPLRSNPAVWFSPIVTFGIAYMWVAVELPIVPDPYWTAYVARAGDGLQYGLPFAAVGAAWASWRQRRLSQALQGWVRLSARIYWIHLWPRFAAVAVGLSICALGQALIQPPFASAPSVGLVGVFAAMTIVATGIGWLSGALLPLPIALPVALFVAFEWAVYPLADGSHLSYRNVTGYALFGCCDSASYQPALRALISPVVVAAGMLVAVHFAVSWRGRFRRMLPSVPALAVAIAMAVYVAAGTGAYGGQLRDATAEHCVGDAPRVCVFREVGSAEERALMEETIRAGYGNAEAAGLSLPSQVLMSARYPVNRTEVTFVSLSGAVDRRQIIQVYAHGIYASLQCTEEAPPDPRVPPGTDVQFALSTVLGLDVESATPQISVGGEEGTDPGRELSPAEIRQLLRVTDRQSAVTLAHEWLTQQYACATGKA